MACIHMCIPITDNDDNPSKGKHTRTFDTNWDVTKSREGRSSGESARMLLWNVIPYIYYGEFLWVQCAVRFPPESADGKKLYCRRTD